MNKAPSYTEKASEFIAKDGGKFGGLEYLKAYVPALKDRVLRRFHVAPERDGTLGNAKEATIVRASHPNDFDGLVDILKTTIVQVGESLDKAVADIREQATQRHTMRYAQYENASYSGDDLVVGLQPFVSPQRARRGSICEHPNRHDMFVISSVEEHWGNDHGCYVHDVKGNVVQAHERAVMQSGNAVKLIEAYKLVRESGLIKDDMTFQIEFGDVGGNYLPYIYQVRGFLRKATADFVLDERGANSEFVFGVTDAEGVTLPAVHVVGGHDWDAGIDERNEQWAMYRSATLSPTSTNFMPHNMRAYLAGASFEFGKRTLEHHHFRAVQKADLTVYERKYHDFTPLITSGAELREVTTRFQEIDQEGSYNAASDMLRRTVGETGKNVRIISDGVRAKVEVL